jgi:hypothetical protein
VEKPVRPADLSRPDTVRTESKDQPISKMITGIRSVDPGSEVTHIDPPRTWGVHGIDDPIRAIVNVIVDPLDDGSRSRLTIEVDFEGHGIGTLLVPLGVRRQARNEMPINLRTVKQRLEDRAKPTSAPR